MSDEEQARSMTGLTTLNAFLDEQGVRAEVTDRAIKRVIAMQLERAMKESHLTRTAMAERMDTSRAQLARILDPDEFNVSLDTLNRAARAVGRQLRIELS